MDRSATPRLSPPLALLVATGSGARLLLTLPPNDPLPTAALVLGWGVSYGLAAWLLFSAVGALLRRVGILPPVRPIPARLLLPGLLLLPGIATIGAIKAAKPVISLTLPAPGPPMCRVELLAMDGADLDDIRRLAARGDLPNFARLLAEGASAPLQTISPHSPVVWTSIATGRKPADHGVRSYTSFWLRGTDIVLPDDPWDLLLPPLLDLADLRVETAVGSSARLVPAIWEIAGRFGVATFFLNWWATWPAEPVSGQLISNLALPWEGFTPADLASPHQQATWPPGLQQRTDATLRAWVAETGADHLVRNAFSVEGSAFFVARDALVWRMLSEFRQPDQLLAAPYMQEIDTSSHAWNHEVYGAHINKKRKKQIPEADADALWETLITAAYRRMDARVGETLATLGSGCLIVVSDHGWDYDGTSHYNKPDGTFLAFGAPFRPGPYAGPAGKLHVFDVLPVLTTLLGLPLSAQNEGHLPADLFTAPPAPATVPSYGPRGQPPRVSAESDDGHLERLRGLGYIE